MTTPNDQHGYPTNADPSATDSDLGGAMFLVKQALNLVRTATLVQVKTVTNAGGLSPVGTVDVVPMINQIDAAGNAIPHTTVFNVPYFRLQGGTDAIILDPKVGDIGIAIFSDRDISVVQANKAPGNPGSRRKHSIADALYLGGFLNGTPQQYVQFTASGINIVSPSKVTITAPVTEIDSATSFTVNAPQIIMNGTLTQGGGSYAGTATYNGNFTVNGVLTNNGKLVGSTHTHTGVQTGSGTTGAPT